MWDQVEEAIRLVCLKKEPLLIEAATRYKSSMNFFEMVRFDFVVDEDLNVYIMELPTHNLGTSIMPLSACSSSSLFTPALTEGYSTNNKKVVHLLVVCTVPWAPSYIFEELSTKLLDEEASLTLSDERSSESALSVARFKKPPSYKNKFQSRNYYKSAFFTSECALDEREAVIVDEKIKWTMDIGVLCYMTFNRDNLGSYVEVGDSVNLGNSPTLEVKGRGNVKIEKFVNDMWIEGIITNVLYTPALRRNLLSEGVITCKGMRIVKSGLHVQVFNQGELVGVGVCGDNNLYNMMFKTLKPDHSEVHVAENEFQLWHERLGHVNTKFLTEVPKVDGVNFDSKQEFFCQGCIYGKQQKLPFSRNLVRSSQAGELIHCDLCGPMLVPSVRGYKYFAIFKDDHSGFKFVRFMKHKNDVLFHFKQVVTIYENKFGHHVQRLRVDNGTEFINIAFHVYLSVSGIVLERTVPYTPEENGRIERESRTVVESARSMLHSRDVPQYL
ncbi:hypothetical protein PR048_008495 [Dryococelus australis]|uniref:Integrase catalytic domain-containing protein n=1 Tax=Dryococelus australis TaxID=614101 RepID=A0ABQ9HXA1_9NEOP|nr:hypothetical protein PR048_008495 [Dryococelus australis]